MYHFCLYADFLKSKQLDWRDSVKLTPATLASRLRHESWFLRPPAVCSNSSTDDAAFFSPSSSHVHFAPPFEHMYGQKACSMVFCMCCSLDYVLVDPESGLGGARSFVRFDWCLAASTQNEVLYLTGETPLCCDSYIISCALAERSGRISNPKGFFFLLFTLTLTSKAVAASL